MKQLVASCSKKCGFVTIITVENKVPLKRIVRPALSQENRVDKTDLSELFNSCINVSEFYTKK